MTDHDHSRSPAVVRNPILPGSHPDPSILHANGAYYVATSTFEWFPGVRIHRSDDLVDWTPLGGALGETRLLDLTGCPDSGGVWAPNLSCVDGVFHLVFSVVSTYTGGFTDAPNYLVTAPSIDGPWSDPVALHARGFDASLFHDGPDSWLVNLVHDWRPGYGGSAGLEVTRFDRVARTLVGAPALLQLPPASGWIEGPNIYRRGGWYYLVTADGGTGYDHQVTVSRAPDLTGPYERCPTGPLITAKDDPTWPLQKAGHGSLVRTPEDEWYLAYLVARPHGEHGPCILGRETALARIEWVDGWPTVADRRPAVEVVVPGATTHGGRGPDGDESDGFDGSTLGPQWSTLRRPATTDWLTLPAGSSRLRIRGGRSPHSLVGPSLVARRVTAARSTFEAAIDYQPRTFQHLAGITAYYNSQNWFFLHVTADDDGAPLVRLISSDRGQLTLHPDVITVARGAGAIRLGLDLDGANLSFRYSPDGEMWQPVGPFLDATVLSDEHAVARDESGAIRTMGFTGAFVGLWAWDLTGGGHPVDVDDATYTPGELMHPPDVEAARVVSAVFREGAPLVLVEDTWTKDTENSPPEGRRTWSSPEGAQVTTMTSLDSSGSSHTLAARVVDALSGAAMERLISAGAPREDMMLAVRRARAADVRDDARCLMVDGTPYSGVSASSEGTTVRGVRVDTTVIVTVTDSGPVTVTLHPP